ncbi:uncharacterized protein [Diabrotica undecimpunctata]|uniref:uncharacterized protein n=1 Tax=Diabrotica undecimpunctata TaxID=50387 RepID=UPI003B6390A9
MDPTKCFICEKPFTEGETEFVGKGIPNVVAASKSRKDGKHELLKNVEVVQVHKNCKVEYTNKDNIKLLFEQAKPNSETKLEGKPIVNHFSFKTKCCLCGKEKHLKSKDSKDFRECTAPSLKDKFLEKASKRNDDFGRQIVERIKNVNLVLMKARYHKQCYTQLFYTPSKTTKKGRPEDQNLISAFEKVCEFINESEERQFTLKDLLARVEDNLPNDGSMSMKTLKVKLQKKYGDGIVFATSLIKPSSIYFLDSGVKHREELRKQKSIQID